MAAAEIIGAIGAGLGGAASAGTALGSIGAGVKSKKKMKYAANLQYEYGEKAAENAYQRQLALLNKTYEQESYQNRVKQMREAGLSIGLMYGNGAQGGGAGSTSGAPAGATNPSVDAGQGVEQAAMGNISRGGLALIEASRNIAEIKNIESQAKANEAAAEKARAEAGLLTEKKITELEMRPEMIAKMHEEGLQIFHKNTYDEWKALKKYEEGHERVSSIYGLYRIIGDSMLSQEETAKILKVGAETLEATGNANAAESLKNLNDEKRIWYWKEILNDTITAAAAQTAADAATQRAAVDKLRYKIEEYKKEYEVGEKLSTRDIIELSISAVSAAAEIAQIFSIVKGLKGLGKTVEKASKTKVPTLRGADGTPIAWSESITKP